MALSRSGDGGPGWSDSLLWTTTLSVRGATAEERKKLHRLGDRPVIALVTLANGATVETAAAAEARDQLIGPTPGRRAR